MKTVEQVFPLRFAHHVPDIWIALEELPRRGWVDRGVKKPESVQDHTISLRGIGFETKLSDYNKSFLLDMLEVHDWPEGVLKIDEVIVTRDAEEKRNKKAIKFEKEYSALRGVCDKLGGMGSEIFNLWLRFEKSDDPLASFARQIDKYQAIEKALEYERTQGIKCFKDFHDYSRNEIKHPFLIRRLNLLKSEWLDLNCTS